MVYRQMLGHEDSCKMDKVAKEKWNWKEEDWEKDVVFLAVLIAKTWLYYDIISIGIVPDKINLYRWFIWWTWTSC